MGGRRARRVRIEKLEGRKIGGPTPWRRGVGPERGQRLEESSELVGGQCGPSDELLVMECSGGEQQGWMQERRCETWYGNPRSSLCSSGIPVLVDSFKRRMIRMGIEVS